MHAALHGVIVDSPNPTPEQAVDHPKRVLSFLLAHPHRTRVEATHKLVQGQAAGTVQTTVDNLQHLLGGGNLVDIRPAKHRRDMLAEQGVTHHLTLDR